MQTIKAAVCHRFGCDLSIEDLHLAPPGAGQVQVTLDAVAICHSDISYAAGDWGGVLPAVYGHEAAGRISALGPNVTGFAMGDHVLVTLIRACGTCASCASGRPVICETPVEDTGPLSLPDGRAVHQGMACGAFAQRVVVDHSQIVTIPPDLPKPTACLLSCGVITGVGAVVYAGGLRAGQDVVVIGAGGVGLNAIQGARIAGARRIIAVDLSPEKLEIARRFGATDVVLGSDPTPWQATRDALGRGADLVLVTVGALPAYDQAPQYLAPGGRMVLVGMPHTGGLSQYEPGNLATAGQGMIGSKMGDVVIARDIPWMIDLYQQGRLMLDELISGLWSLDQINQAIADTRTGSARRNVIVFDHP